ncbi:MAG: restriction endonuclease subunit S [Endomicrobiaceae bacterium]|nr:restriction endonuclease subunit S [Endomicrobiaceae bacterium]MDD3922537.1 restriction endonuclease subunit S [Endomicrobiaceae bacterium]
MNCKLIKLGNIITGKTPSINENDIFIVEKDKYMFVTPRDMKNDEKYIRRTERYLLSKIEESYSNYILKNKSLCISCIGSDMGKVYLIEGNAVTNQQINSITNVDDTICNIEYLYYYFRTQKKYLKSIAGGSTMPILNKNDFSNIKISLPDIIIQNRIVKILSTFDKKIELNNQINANLYKYSINYLKSLARNKMVNISHFGKVQGGYAFKSKDLKDEFTSNKIIKIKNIRSDIDIDISNSQFIDDNVVKDLDIKFKLQRGDVVIAMTGAELGKTGFLYGKGNYYLNQRVGVIKGNNEKKNLYLKILMLSNNFQILLNSKGYGSAQPNISTLDIEKILINDIYESDLSKFYKMVNPIYNRIISNCEENKKLEQLRDILLPELMNDDINIEKI